jgi:predicted transcriptional regulator
LTDRLEIVEMATDIVSAFVGNNAVPASELPQLLTGVHDALCTVAGLAASASEPPRPPAVSIKRSITPDYLICLEDGRQFKSLKRHLRAKFDMSPEEYRRKWGLPADYPMVAPNYAKARSLLAKEKGLGQRRG